MSSKMVLGKRTKHSQSAVILRPTENTLLIEYYDAHESFQSRRIITRGIEMPDKIFDAFIIATKLKEIEKA